MADWTPTDEQVQTVARLIEVDAWAMSDLEWHDTYGRTTSVGWSMQERDYVRSSAKSRARVILAEVGPAIAAEAEGRGARSALLSAAEALNLHATVPKPDFFNGVPLSGLCEDDSCLWWDMTYAARDWLCVRAEQAGADR